MGSVTDRYDREAAAYGRWWAPVLRPTALRVLDLVAAGLDEPDAWLLDLGAGTGTLARAALRRWPGLQVVALDGSSEMIDAGRVADPLDPEAAGRLINVAALAEQLPLPDGHFRAVASSYVLQLVPDREPVLAEVLRVLEPGGRFAFVSWLGASDRDPTFAPDAAFYDLLDDLGIPDELEAEEDRSGDFVSAEAAIAELAAAGFVDATAEEALLVHRYDRTTYARFLAEYAEREQFELFDEAQAAAVGRELDARLRRLPDDAFVWEARIVYATASRPG